MKQDIVLKILRQKNAELTKKFGVKSLSLFGSMARNEATSDSDVDLIVEFNRPVGYFGLLPCKTILKIYWVVQLILGRPIV